MNRCLKGNERREDYKITRVCVFEWLPVSNVSDRGTEWYLLNLLTPKYTCIFKIQLFAVPLRNRRAYYSLQYRKEQSNFLSRLMRKSALVFEQKVYNSSARIINQAAAAFGCGALKVVTRRRHTFINGRNLFRITVTAAARGERRAWRYQSTWCMTAWPLSTGAKKLVDRTMPAIISQRRRILFAVCR